MGEKNHVSAHLLRLIANANIHEILLQLLWLQLLL